MQSRLLLAAAVAALLLAPCLQAQGNCVEVRGLGQNYLGFEAVPFPPFQLYTWTGPTYIHLDGKETFVNDKWYLPPGDPPTTVHQGVVGQDRGGKTLWTFGPAGTLLLEQKSVSVFTMSPGKAGIGVFRVTWRIAGGTGRFAQATGTISEMGPYLVWFKPGDDPAVALPQGKYNAEYNGHICGVQPAQ